jgi:hypothetical protein
VRKMKLNRFLKGEKGQALIIVVLLMLVSALVIAPMLSHLGTGLKSGKEVYEERMELFYAADSGIEDALWQISCETLDEELFGADDPIDYDPYAYYNYDDDYEWDYDLPDINRNAVTVAVRNIWIPEDYITAPSPSVAQAIIEGVDLPRLVISGNISADKTYQVKITYYYDADEDPEGDDLKVSTVGIWLPPGFSYDEDYGDGPEDRCSLGFDPAEEDYCSGKALVWDFPEDTTLVSFPESGGESGSVERSFTFRFEYDGGGNVNPAAALSWIDTSGVTGLDYTYTWDADVKVYQVISTATDDSFDPDKQTTVEIYTATSEVRQLGTAITGDYCAVGNTLMEATGNPYYRNCLYKQTSATVAEFTGTGDVPPGSVPDDARVNAAYLYWSGWIEGEEEVVEIWSDPCDSFDNWNAGSHWEAIDGEFRGQGGGGDRELSMYLDKEEEKPHSLDLSGYTGDVTVSWEQRTQGWLNWYDKFKYAFSGDGGAHWDYFTAFSGYPWNSTFSANIPEEYLTDEFRLRLFVDFNGTNEYVYIDNITITAPLELTVQNIADAKVNVVDFGIADNMKTVTAHLGDCYIAPSDDAAPGAWCYSCFYDATDDIIELIKDEEVVSSGAGTYILSHHDHGGSTYDFDGGGSTDYPLGTPALATVWQYQWSYAGWSLILIYSSPDTEGHQLYIFDEFRYVKVHTTLEFPISGFLVPAKISGEVYAAHMTCFVGDGDEQYSGDYIALKDEEGVEHKLDDGIDVDPVHMTGGDFGNPYDNVWNGQSVGITPGIDIDTFQVEWDDDVLEKGDTSADVVLGNASDKPGDAELIMLVYIIISFRSSVTSGGTISYLVK